MTKIVIRARQLAATLKECGFPTNTSPAAKFAASSLLSPELGNQVAHLQLGVMSTDGSE
jgi:hypothetical protein